MIVLITIITMLTKCVDLVCRELTHELIDSQLMVLLRDFLTKNEFLGPIDLKVKMKNYFTYAAYKLFTVDFVFIQLNSLILKSQRLQDQMYEMDIELVWSQVSHLTDPIVTYEESKSCFYRNKADVVSAIIELSTKKSEKICI
jgi:hypothetical protein